MTTLAGAWSGVRRLLVVRLDAMGDVLMTTPALRAIAAARPAIEITLLTSPAAAAIARLIPEVDDVLVHEASWVKPAPDTDDEGGAGDRRLIETLRAGRFDGAVICTVNTQSALPAAFACRLAGIPLRLAQARENPYRLLTDWVPDPEPLAPVRHEVRRQLDLVAAIGARVEDEHLSVRVPPDAARWVRGRLAELGVGRDRPWVVIHPGASAPSRRYPVEGFAAVARALVGDHGWRVVVAGGPGDEADARAIAEGSGPWAVSLAGELDLSRLAALLAFAPVVVANNSGPAHLAAAVGTPVVDLYALTNLQHAPWGVQSRVLAHDVPCKGCLRSVCPMGHHACLAAVDPAEIVEATLQLAAGGASAAPPAGILPASPVEVALP